MHSHTAKSILVLLLLLTVSSAEAFRCGTKLVREGLTEQEVIASCGSPESIQELGVILRPYVYRSRTGIKGKEILVSGLEEEVRVRAYIYNFGPRKLKRRLVFEGGVLERIESLGYGNNPTRINTEH